MPQSRLNVLQPGWRPRRTVVLCSWDAEEYGLVGSVEFTEKHFKTLTERAIAYLNVDIGVSTLHLFLTSWHVSTIVLGFWHGLFDRSWYSQSSSNDGWYYQSCPWPHRQQRDNYNVRTVEQIWQQFAHATADFWCIGLWIWLHSFPSGSSIL